MLAELVRETEDPRRVVELRERTRRQQSRSGDVPGHQDQENINHKTKYIKISQIQYIDKVVDVTVVIQKQVSPRIKRRTERVGERDSTSGLWLDIRHSEHAC